MILQTPMSLMFTPEKCPQRRHWYPWWWELVKWWKRRRRRRIKWRWRDEHWYLELSTQWKFQKLLSCTSKWFYSQKHWCKTTHTKPYCIQFKKLEKKKTWIFVKLLINRVIIESYRVLGLTIDASNLLYQFMWLNWWKLFKPPKA